MEIIDLQMHEPGPRLTWEQADEIVRRDLLKEILWETMEAVGVDGVVIQPEEDAAFAEQVSAEAPDRIAWVPMLITRGGTPGVTTDASAPDIAEQLATYAARPGVAGVRFVGSPGRYEKFKTGGYDLVFKAFEDQGIPVVLLATGVLDMAATVAERFPGVQLILDHFGMAQRPLREADDPQWKHLPQLLSLARYPNIAVKMCGAPAMSQQGYPYTDVWPQVAQVIETFGVDRVAWGSDISRFYGRIGWSSRPQALGDYVGKHNYMESLAFFLYNDELTDDEKAAILGGTTRRVLRWPVVHTIDT